MKTLLSIGLITLIVVSCEKDYTSASLDPFYKVTIDGQTKNVYACGTTDYVCQFLKDTAMFIGIGCGGERAGFYLPGKIIDGTYQLDNINQAFYSSNQSGSYITNSSNKGTLAITTGNFNGIITVKGVFEFRAIDTATGKILTFTNGSFLMKKL